MQVKCWTFQLRIFLIIPSIQYLGFTIKSWNSDPFIGGGSLSVPSIGTMFAYHTLRQSHGPVHFAGTENAIK